MLQKYGGIFIPHLMLQIISIRNVNMNLKAKERRVMKGYNTENGYMGYVDGEYQLFACEADYEEWMED